jgi:hypothetical protein
VPHRIPRIDDRRGEIVISRMIPVVPWALSTDSLGIDEVRALGARLGVRGTTSKERVVRIYALPSKGEPLELGEAACQDGHAACLAWADPAVARFAERLGWRGAPRAFMADDGELREYVPAAARP